MNLATRTLSASSITRGVATSVAARSTTFRAARKTNVSKRQTKWVILVRRTSNVQCSSPRPRVTLLATAVAPPATTTSHPTANVTQASGWVNFAKLMPSAWCHQQSAAQAYVSVNQASLPVQTTANAMLQTTMDKKQFITPGMFCW